jgi:hypothetical protein
MVTPLIVRRSISSIIKQQLELERILESSDSDESGLYGSLAACSFFFCRVEATVIQAALQIADTGHVGREHLQPHHPHRDGQVLQGTHRSEHAAVVGEEPRVIRGQHVEIAQREGGQLVQREVRSAEEVPMPLLSLRKELMLHAILQNLPDDIEEYKTRHTD